MDYMTYYYQETIALKRSACSLPVNLPKLHWLLAILNGDGFAWLQLVAAVGRLGSCVTDQNLATSGIRLEPRRRIHRVAHGSVLRTPIGTDTTHNHLAGIKVLPRPAPRNPFFPHPPLDRSAGTGRRQSGRSAVR